MIGSVSTIVGMLVLSLIGIWVWSMAHLSEETIQTREDHAASARIGVDIPAGGIGSDSDQLGWTALDDLQLRRLLDGPSQ